MSTVTTIKRGGLTAAIDSMGAQLTSLALNGNEYLWQGDPAFWGKHAPILFPIVGSLRNNTATSAAGTCEMPRHGLARIVEHKLVEVSEDGSSVTYEITDTPESLKAFPFHFKLNMTYALTGDATLTQTFAVTNTGDVDLPFSVGGHPAFNVPAPGAEDEVFEDYELAFTEAWTNEAPIITPDGLMTFEGSYKAPDNSDVLPITHRSFDNDAIMFTDTPGSTLTLRGRKSGHGVKIDFEGFKYIGVWSAANDAPFVALEPGPATPPWTPRTMSLSTRSTPSRWHRALPTSVPLASPCSRGSAVLTNDGPVDAARHPERQFVIQKARHDQKVYALPFSCQVVHGAGCFAPIVLVCLLIFRAHAALLVAGVYPVLLSAKRNWEGTRCNLDNSATRIHSRYAAVASFG